MTAALISVVTIFRDEARFLRDAIESVFAQTDPDWELVLVDDGSTDGSTGIARDWAARHPGRVRYVEHPGHANRGTSASRNLGVQHARGGLLAFLDGDDAWRPDKLARQRAILEAHPGVGLVYGRSEWWFSWTGDIADLRRDRVGELGVETDRVIPPPALLTGFIRRAAQSPSMSSVLVRREVVERAGGFEDRFPAMYDDQAFLAKVCLRTPVFAAGACWDRYRQHPDSCYASAKRTGAWVAARRAFLEWLQRYLAGQGEGSGEVAEAARDELARCPRLEPRTVAVAREVIRRMVPAPVRRWLRARWEGETYVPPVGAVRWGSLARPRPISRRWGFDRGLPVDRHYIARFLAAHARDVGGRVLEIGDDRYTRVYGGGRVVSSDVLDVDAGNPRATLIADLTRAGAIPSGRFDCIVLTQTLQLFYDPAAVVRTLARLLAPGGVVLATVPGISRVHESDGAWYWQFTSRSAGRLFADVFRPGDVTVESYGNVQAASAFLYGLAAEEVGAARLDRHDPAYEVVIGVRARKPAAA